MEHSPVSELPCEEDAVSLPESGMSGGDSCTEESDVVLPGSESDHENDTKSPEQPTGGPQILVPTALDKAHPPGAIDFMEIFSMPRIAPCVRELGLTCGPSLDILNGYDLQTTSMKQQVLNFIRTCEPKCVFLSPPCTVFSQVQHSLKGRRKCQHAWEMKYQRGLDLWEFALKVVDEQLKRGRLAVVEHPAQATSWTLDSVTALMSQYQSLRFFTFDQCLLGLVTLSDQRPVRKRTRFLSNMASLDQEFSVTCNRMTCNHFPATHKWLQGSEGGVSRCRAAERYPFQMCEAVARALSAQLAAAAAAAGQGN